MNLTRWLSRLPLDPRTLRAIDETLCDGRAELATATTYSRPFVCARTLAALVRTLSVADVGSIAWSLRGIAVVRMIVASIVLMAVVRGYAAWQRPYMRNFNLWEFLSLAVLTLPVGAYFAAVTDRDRRPPHLGVARGDVFAPGRGPAAVRTLSPHGPVLGRDDDVDDTDAAGGRPRRSQN